MAPSKIGSMMLRVAAACAAVAMTLSLQPAVAQERSNPHDQQPLSLGFNGRTNQIAAIDHFYGDGDEHGPRLCHYYTGWDTAVHTDGTPDHPSGLAANIAWLENAQANGCDEVMVSFKALSSADPKDEFDPEPPTVEEYQAAVADYLDTDWEAEAGYTGDIVLTAWNEPNLNATAGNGYPPPSPGAESVISPRLAAQYYLAASQLCEERGCVVAAVDFGSNGGRWVDYMTNCATANVPRDQLCAEPSKHNTEGLPPSYLDLYRNEIINAATDFGFKRSFRPAVVAYHGWADTNAFLNGTRHCSSYDDCLLERVLYAFRGSWQGAEIWNTEDGAGQPGFYSHEEMTDERQVEALEYMLELVDSTPRYTRLYWTHIVGSPSRLLITDDNGDVERVRPSMTILQEATRR
ncbi:hypothetical protein [Parenemella sanctibonifatiensis]|uniref:Glycoside hydrolase family 5 domain-containing protein n=1 Tax=Parenemella sanctibonifatiensis TaxID=2016505 RepID=A0A255EP84_9ACTN|nr:hypothetical protein [Parenemella sanctibonifatiensis]OYN91395.1 hypothetical protein CGZ91_08190 [Parenemella sanctibonifatiensis]